jgi:hypothetical protein
MTLRVPLTIMPIDRATERTTLIAAMAADLVCYGAASDERAAIRVLSGRGYALGDITALVDEACARAAEIIEIETNVAGAMKAP